jgi:hypothetical protein
MRSVDGEEDPAALELRRLGQSAGVAYGLATIQLSLSGAALALLLALAWLTGMSRILLAALLFLTAFGGAAYAFMRRREAGRLFLLGEHLLLLVAGIFYAGAGSFRPERIAVLFAAAALSALGILVFQSEPARAWCRK